MMMRWMADLACVALWCGGEEAREKIMVWRSGRGRVLQRLANGEQHRAMRCAWPDWLLRLLEMGGGGGYREERGGR